MAIWYLYSLLIILAVSIFTKHFLHKIQNLPPTPFPCLPIIGHLYLLKKPLYRTLSLLANRNGHVLLLRLGSRPVLLVSSPSAAEECFTRNDIVMANRPHFLIGKHLGYNYTVISWAPYGDHLRNLRRIASVELLSTSRLQMLYHIRANEVRTMIRSLLDSHERVVDLRASFFEFTLNVLMRMIAGKRYYGENVEDVKEANRFREFHAETFKLSGSSVIGDFLPWIKFRDLERRMIECQKKRDEFMQDLIEERRKMKIDSCSGDGKKTMIDVLLSLQESEPEYYSDQIIKGLMLVLLMAGTDTTINTMEWALSLLLNHPEELKRAEIEILNQVPEDRLLDESDLPHLPYLRCIINEAMRMYPAVPLLPPHESSAECSVGGFRIPSGTTLMVNVWAIHNDPKIWEDPTKFKPERFKGIISETAGAGMKDRTGFSLMPFGYGRRSCPGDGLAMRVVALTIGSLIQCFEWTRVDEEMVDMTEGVSFTLRKAKPLQAKYRTRPSMAAFLSRM